MKKQFIFFLTFFTSVFFYGQDFQSEFLKHCEENDTINQLKVLKKWSSSNSNDPELYTSYFNYYFGKSRKEIIIFTDDQPQDGFKILDSLNQVEAFIGSQIDYDESDLKKGFSKIDEGIKLFPNRLDMRFGKIYALGELKNWKGFIEEILKAVKHSSINDNKWTWTNNETENNGKGFFLSNIQSYQYQLYNTGDDSLLINMREICNEILKYYPTHVESLSSIAITYLINEDFDKALQYLLKAEEINPKDTIVLANIAHAYRLKGEKQTSILYYEKVIEFGDEDTKEFAKQVIEELKN